MTVPQSAVKYILFQRTQYLICLKSRLLNRLVIRMPSKTFNWAVSVEALFTRSRVERLFEADVKAEYESIKPYLPEQAAAILDIGCGVAGIDVKLAEHYKASKQEVTLSLLDKTEMPEKVYYGFEKKGCYYNSLAVARELLEANGIAPKQIMTQEVGADGQITFTGPFDLVTSLISWGFHYPVKTYLAQVHTLLRSGGVLILDVRKASTGVAEIKKQFGNIKIIAEFRKHQRVAATK